MFTSPWTTLPGISLTRAEKQSFLWDCHQDRISVLVELADPSHKVITSKAIDFTVPDVHDSASTVK
jgi:hypothetical protein